MATFQELSEAIQKGQAPKAKELTQALLGEKKPRGDPEQGPPGRNGEDRGASSRPTRSTSPRCSSPPAP